MPISTKLIKHALRTNNSKVMNTNKLIPRHEKAELYLQAKKYEEDFPYLMRIY